MSSTEQDWLDKTITHYVNRPLIHEDRWTDLKQAISKQHAVELLEARIDAVEYCYAAATTKADSHIFNYLDVLKQQLTRLREGE